MTCLVSMPGLTIFKATLRRIGSTCLGHEDDAETAFADLFEQLVVANDCAGGFGDSGRMQSRLPPKASCSRNSPACSRARKRASTR